MHWLFALALSVPFFLSAYLWGRWRARKVQKEREAASPPEPIPSNRLPPLPPERRRRV